MLLLSLLFAAAVSPALTDSPFLQRVADNGYGRAPVVTAGSLPPGWTSPVPLPTDPVLGSIRHASPDSVEVFYAPADSKAFYNAYQHQLLSAGFAIKTSPAPASAGGGFTEQGALPQLTLYCRGVQAVTVRIPSARADDVRVDVPLAATPAAFNSCTGSRRAAFGAFFVLPQLIAPKGVEVSSEGSMGSSASFGADGVSANMGFNAVLTGKIGAGALLRDFDSQFRRAGWRISSRVATNEGALSNYRKSIGGKQWDSMLAIYAGTQPNTFEARVMASGAPPSSPQPPPPATLARIPNRVSKAQRPALLELVGRVIGAGNARITLLLHRVPPDLPEGVPLPQGALLGSTVTAPRVPGMGFEGQDMLYYDLTQSELSGYLRALKEGGWQSSSGVMPPTGFSSVDYAQPAMYCKASMPVITVGTQSDSSAVTLIVQRSSEVDGCPMPPFGELPFEEAHLPNIVVPSQSVHRWSGYGGSGASFESALDPAALLQNFAAQLAAQHWTAGPALSNSTVATQTFTLQQPQKPAQLGVLSIYRKAPDSRQYSAVIDVTSQP